MRLFWCKTYNLPLGLITSWLNPAGALSLLGLSGNGTAGIGLTLTFPTSCWFNPSRWAAGITWSAGGRSAGSWTAGGIAAGNKALGGGPTGNWATGSWGAGGRGGFIAGCLSLNWAARTSGAAGRRGKFLSKSNLSLFSTVKECLIWK